MGDERRELLEEIFRSSPDALIVVGADGIIESVSPAAQTVFGYPPEELAGQPVEVLLPDSLSQSHVGHRAGYLANPSSRPMGIGLDLRGRHRSGGVFPVDVSLVPTFIGGRLRVGAFVRDSTERRRGEDVLRFVNEISRSVLAGGPTEAMLSLVAKRARRLIGAEVAWVAVQSRGTDEMVVAADDGLGADSLMGAVVPAATSLAAKAMKAGRTVAVPDMASDPAVLPEARAAGLGPGLYLPMLAEEGPVGALVLARLRGDQPFGPTEVSSAEVFASAAAIVLALGLARQAVEQVRITSDHERIARDLHDTVIQRLFALGMHLQAAERLAEGVVAERISATVDSIDEVIREIRETIFDLNRPDGDGLHLRSQVREVVREASESVGVVPRIAFRGPVEAAVSEELTPHLLSVLREALSNIGRHAKASMVDVVLVAAEGSVTLSVADDGVGVTDVPMAGHGLANMAARAESFGGELSLTRRTPSGTLLQWRVPRPA